ncbi:GAF domain-containing protein [Spirulina subsalsa FACHB-351]|uniref:GAF domain-containing protein n=1 Tax=Spirulina subsalsa FACHB-351 TaxID=234711 RepID=A0ABT3L3W2_9CYAN|nr:GAF domain-containing protein [Spirulina subsalsa]MCW6036208.1 GAF domain-containing protein [Spirulina subsalsa FACHB-351]
MASIQHFLPKLEKSPDAIMEYWLTETEQQSKLLQAVLDPHNFKILYANDQFCYWSGIAEEGGDFRDQDFCLFDLFADFEIETQQALYRRHIFPLILRDIYGIEPPQWRLSDEPHVVTFYNEVTEEKHYIQFWLRSEHLRVERIDPELDEFGEIDWENQVSLPSQLLEERIQWSNYRVRGQLLWEGFEITRQETIRRLMDLLISCESMFEQDTFCAFGDQMRSLFHAETLAILSLQQGQVQFLICNRKQLDTHDFDSLDDFPGSHFLRAAEGNRVWNVPNLEQDHPTVLEEYLLDKGCGSLLLIPLRLPLSEMEEGKAGQLLGVVAMGSQRANNFEQIDACHAEELIPALRMALREATGEKLARVHPSVEWRFRQEAERRSLGMASEPIVFAQVYPLYGMSDIRGSSQERNRAIQEDLVAQFQSALELVESALEFKAIAFLEQLKLDLLAYLERLQGGIQVEDETTALQYLRQHIEVYFDYFRQCGEKTERQVREYLEACGNEHHCIYTSRDRYDQQINQLNHHLRETWDKWQSRMQDIFPHYCDLQVSDGIDHMVYVGSSIHEGFSPFHLHSLRYEQLRALCDCDSQKSIVLNKSAGNIWGKWRNCPPTVMSGYNIPYFVPMKPTTSPNCGNFFILPNVWEWNISGFVSCKIRSDKKSNPCYYLPSKSF